MTSEAPERIWALADRRKQWSDTPPEEWSGHPTWHWSEYIRADLHQQALDAAREEGRRAGLEEAAKIADNCVEQECCGCFHIVQISEDEGYEECCGNPNITPMYPNEVASKIIALIDKPGDPVAEAARVLLGNDYESPILEALDPFNNDVETHRDVLSALRALAQKERQ